jgi:hypothetical protein
MLPVTAEPSVLPIDLPSLMFMLADGGGQTLNDLQLADQRYKLVLAVVARRSEAHLAIQAHLADATTSEGLVDLVHLRQLLKPHLRAQLEHSTDQLYETCGKALELNRTVYAKLDSETRVRFPKAALFHVSEDGRGDTRSARE